MIVRSIDLNNDWNFGRGKSSYCKDRYAVAQSIKTNLQCFLNDCFFDSNKGVDWFTLLGAKSQIALKLAISTTILSVNNVTGIVEISMTMSNNRNMNIRYEVDTVFGIVSGEYRSA